MERTCGTAGIRIIAGCKSGINKITPTATTCSDKDTATVHGLRVPACACTKVCSNMSPPGHSDTRRMSEVPRSFYFYPYASVANTYDLYEDSYVRQ
jgi:hypothetical protein